MAPNPAPLSPAAAADAMDAMHEKGIKAFPAKTAGQGQPAARSRGWTNGVKVFELTAKKIQWETEPGQMVEAWAYNDQVPGPQIRVREGDRVRVDPEQQAARVDRDSLSRPGAAERSGRRAVHHAAAGQAGRVATPTSSPCRTPARTCTTRTTTRRSRSASGCSARSSSSRRTAADRERRRRLRAHPQRRRARLHVQRQELSGDRADRREAGPEGAHSLHERRHDDPPDAPARHAHDRDREGRLESRRRPGSATRSTSRRASGRTSSSTATIPGTWAFHCHILPHAESDHGMFGMVTALIVK